MKYVPAGNYATRVLVDDSYEDLEGVVVNQTWVSLDEIGVTVDIAYFDDELFWVEYRLHSELHRTDGPARIIFSPDGSIEKEEFAINGYLVEPNLGKPDSLEP